MIKTLRLRRFAVCLAASAAVAGVASAEEKPNVHGGRAEVYRQLDSESLEHVTTSDALLSAIRQGNVAPTRVWKLLEHGEKVECLACIPYVSRLLFDGNAKNREISAWWLRRRVFGVFGEGEVYSQVASTVADRSQSDTQRAFAANAIGEFLSPAGVKYVAKAAVEDPAPVVRVAAVEALQRLNHEGPDQELGKALADDDEAVRLSALKAAISVNVFSNVEAVVERIDDDSPLVRRRAAEALGALRAADAVVALVALTEEGSEPDAAVRSAAVWALGQIGDGEGREAVEAALEDSNSLVRNSATIALRRL